VPPHLDVGVVDEWVYQELTIVVHDEPVTIGTKLEPNKSKQ